MSFDTPTISDGLQRTQDHVARAVDGVGARSVHLDIAHEQTARFQVLPGDRAPGDGPTQERAELSWWDVYPYNGAFVTAGWFTCDAYDLQSASPSQAPLVVRQLRYVHSPDPGAQPEFTMNMYPRTSPGDTAGKWGLQFRSIQNGAMMPPPPGTSATVVSGASGSIWDYDYGQWVYVVTRTTFGQGSAGRVEVWTNSSGLPSDAEKILDVTGNFGYGGVNEFRIRFGLYSYAWTLPRQNRHHKTIWGPATELDAEALADFPPPRIVD